MKIWKWTAMGMRDEGIGQYVELNEYLRVKQDADRYGYLRRQRPEGWAWMPSETLDAAIDAMLRKNDEGT